MTGIESDPRAEQHEHMLDAERTWAPNPRPAEPVETVITPIVRGIGKAKPDDAIRQRIEHEARRDRS